MRGMWSTVALVLVLAGLGAYIYFVDSSRPAPGVTPNERVFAVEADQIQEVRLIAGGDTTVLVKKDAGWQMTEPTTTEADPTEAMSLASNISSLQENRVVDENATDLAPYGLAEPRIRVAFKAEGDVSGEVLLGDKTPMQGDLYAIRPGTTKVFLVSSYLETTFDKKPFDLRDKRVVKFERDKVDSIELTRGRDTLRLTRSDSEWKVEQPMTGRGDDATVEGLLTRLSTAGMGAIVEDTADDVKKFGLAEPAMRITVGSGSSTAALEIGRTEGDTTYARDRARPMVFTLDTTLRDDLARPFDDYYKKDLFESRPFSTERLRLSRLVDRTQKTWEFVKSTGEAGEQWQVTPDGGPAADADGTKVNELLNKLAALRMGAFAAPKTRTGLEAPVLVAGVSYDDGKFERVRVGRVGNQPYGTREGEQVIGQVDQASLDAVWQALDEALAPPAKTAETPSQP